MSTLPVSPTTPLPPPTTNGDGTRTAVIAAPPRVLNESALLTVYLPAGLATAGVNGRYFLARCGVHNEEERWEQWQIYLRRPLFGVQRRPGAIEGVERWELHLPRHGDPGYQWLLQQPVGQTLNLLGPFGQGFTIQPHSRNLLLLSDASRAPLLFGLSDTMLDSGGRVTLLVYGAAEAVETLTPLLSIPVEVRPAPTDELWNEQLAELVPWADQICAALPNAQFPAVADLIRRRRFRVDNSFAQALFEADLLCGVGACLACVVPVRNGSYTRACVHGPVMALLEMS